MRALIIIGLVMLLPTAPARANPDIWVNWNGTYRVEPDGVAAIAFEWRFDQYFSAQRIAEHDVDGDGAFSAEETEALKAAVFDPMAEHHHYLHVRAAGVAREPAIEGFEADINEGVLVLRFQAVFAEPIGFRHAPLTISLQDQEVIYDFDFAEGQFLLVEGPFDPACKFQVGRGEGPLSRHKKTVTLLCEG